MTLKRHPREQIAEKLARIYSDRMTTTSGGNLSIRTGEGDIWITPAGTDKGRMTSRDVVRCRANGAVEGSHRPSSELPFHRAIYQRRPDFGAIIHAHSPALVAFSIVGRTPDTTVLPQANHICGTVGFAPYDVPGSEALGESIAQAFERGCKAVIMENHGTVVAGSDMADAFARFTTLELCAQTLIGARRIGEPHSLAPQDVARYERRRSDLPERTEELPRDADEQAVRDEISEFVRRACRQGIMISTYGTVSVRLGDDDFVITPTGCDRWTVAADELVRMRHGTRAPGSSPSRSTQIHRAIYARHPQIDSVILTQSPNAMAFALTGRGFNTRSIPESYLLLRDIPTLPFAAHYGDGSDLAEVSSPDNPVVLVANDGILVTGSSLLEAYDRLEVAEFSARSIIESQELGTLRPIDETAISELRKAFGID